MSKKGIFNDIQMGTEKNDNIAKLLAKSKVLDQFMGSKMINSFVNTTKNINIIYYQFYTNYYSSRELFP